MSESVNHKAFLQSLTPADRARLRARSDFKGLQHFALHALLIVLLGTLIALQVPGWFVLLIPQGIALAFLFTLEHECTHKTPFETAWLNELAGSLAGLLIIQPFYWFRYYHMAHHRHTNDPEHDPELAGKPKPTNWIDYLLHVSSITYWKGKVVLLFTNAFGLISAPYSPETTHAQLRREARVYIVIYALVVLFTLFVSEVLFWAWFAPLIIGFPFLRLYLLAEHGRCPAVDNVFNNTRTTYTNRLVRFLAWNMPYHIEHHVLPSVPFHRLPEFHQQTQAHLLQTAQGYTRFTKQYCGALRPNSDYDPPEHK